MPDADTALSRFLAAPGAPARFEWLDAEGRRADGGRQAALEVRLTKKDGGRLLIVRLPIAEAEDAGLITRRAVF